MFKVKLGSRAEKNKKKSEEEKKVLESLSYIKIPPYIFRNTPLSVLETVVDYLKIDQGLSFHEIGILLDRDERNIWTVFNRAQKKK